MIAMESLRHCPQPSEVKLVCKTRLARRSFRDSWQELAFVNDDDSAADLRDVGRAQDLAHRYGCDYVDLNEFRVPAAIVKIVPVELMFRYNFVPLEGTADLRIAAAFADPSQLMLIDEVSLLLGKRIIPRVATLRQISVALGRLGEGQETDENITQKLPPQDPLDTTIRTRRCERH